MRIDEIFKIRNSKLLNIYFTAGYPSLNSTTEIIKSLEAAGADMIEIGIPYSDPVSDGVTIQKSNECAIQNGITIDMIFDQLNNVSTQIPIMFMAYFNSIYTYGVEDFCKKSSDAGISGLIIPDLPIDIYKSQYKRIFDSYQLCPIFLITPETSIDRIKLIDEESKAFIYAVSSSSTTGKSKNITDSLDYIKNLSSLELKTPLMVGFNIKSNEDYELVSKYTNGAIIGSAFIRQLSKSKNLETDIIDFVQKIKHPEYDHTA